MFYFRINASIRRFSFELHIVWNINDNIFQNLLQNFEKKLGFTFKIWLFITDQYYLYFVGHVVVMRGVEHCQKERRLANWWRKAWYRD
jgi:hypothetical protein